MKIDFSAIQSFREIPEITSREISDIEALKREYKNFTYGITPSIEAFIDEKGEINGYAALYCDWLTKIFGIKFNLEIYEWHELINKLDSHEVDFAIHFLAGEELPQNYLISEPVAERQFIITYLQGRPGIDQISIHRKPVYAFTSASPTESAIASVLGRENYEAVFINHYDEAYSLLERGEADALITTRAAESNFISYNDLIHEDFLPLTYSPVSMIAAKQSLRPIFLAIDKALRNGASSYLNYLYDKGYDEYRQYKFLMSLNDEEKSYLENVSFVPVAAQYFNYPMVFYDGFKKKWDGIAFDLLDEINFITGLTFKVINEKHTEMIDLIQMLSGGEAHLFSDLVFSGARAPHFIWSEHKLMPDQYALLSKINFPNIHLNEIPQAKIALIKNTAHAEMFRTWFPKAENTIEYDAADEAFIALEKGDVDMVMAAKSKLLYYSNYYEFSGYKANYLFNYFYESAFAFNKEQVVLRSIIDKALAVIDTNIIVEQWVSKTYDYSAEISQAQRPWFIGAIIMSVIILSLLLIIFIRNKRHTVKLQKEHERTRIMLDTLPIACFMGTASGTIYDCNDEAVRLFELKDKQEFIDLFDSRLSPEYQPDGKNSYDELIKYGVLAVNTGKCVFEWMHQLLDGTPLPSIVTLECVEYRNEKFLIVYIRDMREHVKMSGEISRQNELLITANKLSSILLEPNIGHFEEILRRSMGIMAELGKVERVCIWKNSKEVSWLRFSLIYQWEETSFKTLAKDGVLANDIWLADHPTWHAAMIRGNCVNSLVRNMTPGEQAEIASRNIAAILAVPVFLQEQFWGFVSFERCKSEEVMAGSEILILRSASRMIINSVIRNEMSDELVFAKDQAEQSNRSKSIFLSHMSHEIRTPMNAILGITEIQLRDENITPDTKEAFGKIYESGDLLLNIINDILDLSKIESGKLEITPTKYDIPSLINDTVQLNRLRYDSKPIEFFLYVDPQTPVDFLGDELRIKQILNNILSNAYKYTDEGKIDFYVSAEYDKNLSDENAVLVFRIDDTGQGMNEDQLKRLFVEYMRFNLEVNRTTVGAGLGMSITKRLIDLMNGTIEIKSEPGKGSSFTVKIPQIRIGKNICGEELTQRLQNFNFQNTTIMKKTRFLREYMPYGSVLVVDDVDSNIYVTKGMLLPYGLKIDTVTSGFAAIEKIKEGLEYDIIFMDHMMPKMDGIETTKNLRKLGYTNPIIALTANALVGRAEMFMKNGFDGFISKPIDSRELNLYLNDFIRNRKPQDVVEAARKEQNEKNLSDNDITAQDLAKTAEMADLFILDASNAINILEDLHKKIKDLNKDELELYVITVHGIKSTLANMGEKELSGAAFKLEIAGNERNIIELANVTPSFIDSLRALILKYKPERNENNDEISSVDLEFLQEELEKIKAACAKFDKNKAKKELQVLKQKTWPSNVNNLLDEIAINILHSAFKKVIAVIDEYK